MKSVNILILNYLLKIGRWYKNFNILIFSETLYGYKNLKIKIIYDALNFWCYVTSSYDLKVKPDPVSGLEPEDYMSKLKEWLPEDCFTNKDDFKKKMLESKSQGPFGEILSEFQISGHGGNCILCCSR